MAVRTPLQQRPLRDYETDEELLPQVLRPYKAHCKYLQSATVSTASSQNRAPSGASAWTWEG